MYVAHRMLYFVIDTVLELLMDLNTATQSHTIANNLGLDSHCPSPSWKGLVPEGSPLLEAQLALAILPRDPLAEEGHSPDSRVKGTTHTLGPG